MIFVGQGTRVEDCKRDERKHVEKHYATVSTLPTCAKCMSGYQANTVAARTKAD
jgi:hypothetical protein